MPKGDYSTKHARRVEPPQGAVNPRHTTDGATDTTKSSEIRQEKYAAKMTPRLDR